MNLRSSQTPLHVPLSARLRHWMKLPAAILFSGLFFGCASTAPRVEGNHLAGTYRNGDGFWPRVLELKADGSYSYIQMTDVLKEDGQGRLIFEGGWASTGRWIFKPPDQIELSADGTHSKIVLFVRKAEKSKLAILEPDLFPDILQRWKTDGGWSYLKEQKTSNQSPTPAR